MAEGSISIFLGKLVLFVRRIKDILNANGDTFLTYTYLQVYSAIFHVQVEPSLEKHRVLP